MSNSEVANGFIKGLPLKKSWRTVVREGRGANTHNFYSDKGTVRFGYDEEGVELMSYERFAVARWLDKERKQLLINGDNGPTMKTREQQHDFRNCSALREFKKEGGVVGLVPFSALHALESLWVYRNLTIVATTPDRTEVKVERCTRKKCWDKTPDHTHERHIHYLGETLLKYVTGPEDNRLTRYIVSGLDRNDDPSKRNFFLAVLPPGKTPRTVDQALDALRPRSVPKDALRQGEWYFLPTDKKFPKDKIVKELSVLNKPGIPILSDDPKVMLGHFAAVSWDLRWRVDRHRASRVVLNGALYVQGMVRDRDHGSLKLGDGKTWFKVVKNLSVESRRAGGSVD